MLTFKVNYYNQTDRNLCIFCECKADSIHKNSIEANNFAANITGILSSFCDTAQSSDKYN